MTNSGSQFDLLVIWLAWEFQEIAPTFKTVPETDTGGQGEYPKALERTRVKELGKMVP